MKPSMIVEMRSFVIDAEWPLGKSSRDGVFPGFVQGALYHWRKGNVEYPTQDGRSPALTNEI